MSRAPSWLNRGHLAGVCLTSLFGDMCCEMVPASLPGFTAAIGVAAAPLGRL
jgi:hypothetical protein